MSFQAAFWTFFVMAVLVFANGVYAVTAMGATDARARFQEIGLLEDGKVNGIPVPPRKPDISEMAMND